MKALVTGAAGFIGSHSSAALLDAGAQRHGHRLLHRLLLRAPIKEANLVDGKGRAGLQVRGRRRFRMSISPAPDGVTHVFHLAGQAGVRKSWGSDFDVYTRDNIAGDSAPA